MTLDQHGQLLPTIPKPVNVQHIDGTLTRGLARGGRPPINDDRHRVVNPMRALVGASAGRWKRLFLETCWSLLSWYRAVRSSMWRARQ